MELKVRLISWSVSSTSLIFCAYQQGGGRPWSQVVKLVLLFLLQLRKLIQNDKAFYSSAAQAQEPGSNCLSFPEEGSDY